MKTCDFRKLIKKYLAPALHELGFSGTDHHFVRVDQNHVIYTIVIQADKHGGSCVVELGVHFDFLPNSIGQFIPASKLTVYDCECRTRIVNEVGWFQSKVLRKRANVIWFQYGDTEDESKAVLNKMKELIVNQSTLYFSQFRNFPHPVTSITIKELSHRTKRLDRYGAPMDVRLALLITRTHAFLGNKAEAANFARWGLENSSKAKGLTQYFTEIIDRTN
ncbi:MULTISPECIES: DUF4304 domain-containing protein [unclassified Paenibacillus]|uniref:DUF4304 domain-containing protein n=1 Tax=unclassified Paenibacillus TaxID=185978 RepID=UPI0024071811|nr:MULTISPECIES: DUF4304 domain-containing protein [unclassified Paenibacillus]MDF9841501.1 hypothetical protein [Paenibacillus sp. PastF-2]MDF9848090.1 hypothetical protein [Paenibacillus sp. PastM-2]MDF9854659.1 hypothetical protein [Paenibacillus sp. PastF-1]MDH6479733.1 hypothetical protein [Paenibacillus sp. PastH-2]MDH6507365.1 hypothetical protein [Paenibacillus sp. PastM-3]